ncbi:hypothetical protein FHR83_007003 [Actinoplanes campanulatus]|uniref:Uncharacterized protein n=1 Tax=Actinoplanes campanulatus TaxID=113559 RepID=A0A7W5FI95_9ACTN|nr:hypothetical protein [Actinoplanes campanulatus]MBB3099297.1 hypothetical protein [Actinoplanes campanulatus]GGN40583.1 hypothetical protein GCM10010109_69880 [Actinoplanes campanulatus]GID40615.1 hypothetical protein Aca09nite_71210 [Actinoplanes campanulatus]
MSYPPSYPPGYKPPQQPKPKRTLPIVLGAGGGVLVLCLGGFLAIGATADREDRPAGTVTTRSTATTVVTEVATSRPATRTKEADPERDLGAGKPGAFCATNRRGQSFTKDGVRYTCKGPKPYRWRRD